MTNNSLKMLEAKMTPAQKKKREEIVRSMKSNKEDMKKRYGDRWEEVMYATATKQALGESKAKPDFLDLDKDGDKKEPMKKAVSDKAKSPVKKVEEAKKAKPDFLDIDKDGDKKEPMKKAASDKKKKKVTEGVLDSTDDDGWMAKSQLYKLAKYAAELHKMINDSDDLEPWVQAKITAASEDISAVKHYMEYLLTGGDDLEAVAATAEPEQQLPVVAAPEKKSVSIDDILRSPMSEAKKKSLRNPKDNPCWDGYEPVGTKKARGKTVPNCVPKKK